MTYVVVVERWWNGHFGDFGRHRIRLRDDGALWAVESETAWEHTAIPCADEQEARAALRAVLEENGAQFDEAGEVVGGPWRRVDPLIRRPPGGQAGGQVG